MRQPAREHAATMMRRRRRRRVLGVLAVLAAVAVAGGGYAHEHFGRPLVHVVHWWQEARAPIAPDAIRVVVLGDSSAMGIGASRPSESLAGRVAAHLRECDPVHVSNIASGGADTTDVLDQALTADMNTADLVLVSVGSADVLNGVPLAAFERDLASLLDVLPTDRTVFSDIAAVPGHRPYQEVLSDLADDRGIARAQFEQAFQAAGRDDVFAPDGLHLNSVGYGIWFDSVRPVIETVTGHCQEHS